MADLLPCPFCGGIPDQPEWISGGVSIECPTCGIDCVFTVTKKAIARKAWNRRTPARNEWVRPETPAKAEG